MAKQNSDLKVLFLSKNNNEYADRAADFVRRHFSNPLIYQGDRFTPLSPEVKEWKGDLLISFISSWVLPESILSNVSFAAINFHPGSPEYPGIGCTNFAIYEGAKEYGVTCHHMSSKVDAGNIISVKRFPLMGDESVFSVTQECYRTIEQQFYEIMEQLLDGKGLPVSEERWMRKPFTRKQLDRLCEITCDMEQEEVERRIRATTFDRPWAWTRIGSHIFKLQAE